MSIFVILSIIIAIILITCPLWAQAVAWGDGASVTFPSGMGFMAASARISLRQGIMTATGFGKAWRSKHGGVKEYSVAIAGVLTYGSTNDALTATMAAGGVAITITFASGCTFSDTMVQSENTAGASRESAGDAAYSFEGPTTDSGPTVTWA